MTRSADRAQFLADTLVDAIEGGIGRGIWYTTEQYRWYSPRLGGTSEPGPEGTANASVTLHLIDEEVAGEPVVRITLDSIASALQQITRGEDVGVGTFQREIITRSSRTNDPVDDYDAISADVVLQVAALGEVIYA